MVRGAFFLLTFLFAAAQAQAALVGNLNGTISIGTQRINSPTEASVGKVVQVGPNSSATVWFANGCSAEIEANGSLTIPEEDPQCEGVVATTGGDQTLLVVGGLIVAGGAAAIILSQDSDSVSVSVSASP
jgi:hypothetical protein